MSKRALIPMKAAAKLAGISRLTVAHWRDAGKLKVQEQGTVGHVICTLVDPEEIKALAKQIVRGRKPPGKRG